MKNRFLLSCFLILLCTLSLPGYAVDTDNMAVSLVSEKKIRDKIAEIKDTKVLDDEAKNNLLSVYSKTLDNLDALKSYQAQTASYQKLIKTAPDEIKKLKKAIAQAEQKKNKPVFKPGELKRRGLLELEQMLNSESANLTAVETQFSDLKQTQERESGSAEMVRKQLIDANHKLELLLDEKNQPQTGISDEQKRANKWYLDTSIAALRSELKMLDQQLLSLPVRLELLEQKKNNSALKLKRLKQKVAELQKIVEEKRSSDIQKTQDITRSEQQKAEGKHPIILKLAKSNSQLSEQINEKNQKLKEYEKDENKVDAETRRIMEAFSSTRKKLNIAGLNQVMGEMLLEQRKSLPEKNLYLKRIDKREKYIARSNLQKIQYQEELRELSDTQAYIQKMVASLPEDIKHKVAEELKPLLQTRKKLLKKIIELDRNLLKAVAALDFIEKKLLKVSEQYRQLLDEHLFWLRSAPVLNVDNIKNIPSQVLFYISPANWNVFLKDVLHTLKNTPVTFSVVMLFIIILISQKRKFKEKLIEAGEKTCHTYSDSLGHTFRALFYTLLLSLPLSVFVFLAGLQLEKMVYVSDFTHAIATGLIMVAPPLFFMQFFRYLCTHKGVAEVHFNWPGELTHGLNKELLRMIFFIIPSIFVTTTLAYKGASEINGGLGRLSLIVVLVTYAIFYYRLFKPETGLFNIIARNNPRGLYARYQKFWFYLSQLGMLALIILTLVGYVYTAGQLAINMMQTIHLIFIVILVQQLVLRWLVLSQRKYALQRAREKRREALKNRDSAIKENDDGIPISEFEEPEINIASLSEESKKLLNFILFIAFSFGLYLIWSDVFPALNIFQKVELWQHKGMVDGVEKMIPVTLSNVIWALVIIIITLIAGKRLPAIIEILMIQAKVHSGNRYTITTLINYTIIGIGFFIVVNMLGVDWVQLQWMFAALSVGIGFGLQEIVANFISGIILLFERPIRVGDYVSIGENEGTVSRIRIRATTIMTRDRKELLVPNKEFITGQLLNWSLSDPVARLKIPVGVAYGSDIPLARQLMLEAARENELVMTEPEPRVLFLNFGDNTLDLQLRCFIGNVDYRRAVTSEINEAINNKFIEAGISIAFPQRDVHLDISQPIDIRLQDDKI